MVPSQTTYRPAKRSITEKALFTVAFLVSFQCAWGFQTHARPVSVARARSGVSFFQRAHDSYMPNTLLLYQGFKARKNRRPGILYSINGEKQAEMSSWRLDPSESFSDYTIYVSRRKDGNATTIANDDDRTDVTHIYHVHRVVLAFGPCPSGYFKMAFQRSNMSDGSSQFTEMILTEVEASVFPILLNSMYHGFHGEKWIEKIRDYSKLITPAQAQTMIQMIDYLDMPMDTLKFVPGQFEIFPWPMDMISFVPDILSIQSIHVQEWCIVCLLSRVWEMDFNSPLMREFQNLMDEHGIILNLLDILVTEWPSDDIKNVQQDVDHLLGRCFGLLVYASSDSIFSHTDQVSAFIAKMNEGTMGEYTALAAEYFMRKHVPHSVTFFDMLLESGLIKKGFKEDDERMWGPVQQVLVGMRLFPDREFNLRHIEIGTVAATELYENFHNGRYLKKHKGLVRNVALLLDAISLQSHEFRQICFEYTMTELHQALKCSWYEHQYLYSTKIKNAMIAASTWKEEYESWEILPTNRRSLTGKSSPWISSVNIMKHLILQVKAPLFLQVLAYIAAGTAEDIQSIFDANMMDSLMITAGQEKRSIDANTCLLYNILKNGSEDQVNELCGQYRVKSTMSAILGCIHRLAKSDDPPFEMISNLIEILELVFVAMDEQAEKDSTKHGARACIAAMNIDQDELQGLVTLTTMSRVPTDLNERCAQLLQMYFVTDDDDAMMNE